MFTYAIYKEVLVRRGVIEHEPQPQRRDLKWDTMFTSSRWETPAKGGTAAQSPRADGAARYGALDRYGTPVVSHHAVPAA